MGCVLPPEQEEGHCDYGTRYHRKRGGQGAGKGQSIEGRKVTEKRNNTIRETGGQCTERGTADEDFTKATGDAVQRSRWPGDTEKTQSI